MPVHGPGTPDWRETLELEGGTMLRLRMIRPDDRAKLAEGFAALSMDSRVRRFVVPKVKLSGRELDYLTEVDGHDHIAVVAIELAPDGAEGQGVGVARAVRLGERPAVAEVAVTVIDAFQGRGIGTILVRRLAGAAAAQGIRTLRFEALATNTRVWSLLEDVGVEVRAERAGPLSAVEVDLPTSP